MASPNPSPQASASPVQRLKTLGESSAMPTLLATLITPLHLRPFQTLPMLFPPVFLFSTYVNLQGLKTDSAGISAAWSAAYLVLASRRKPPTGFRGKFTARGALRGVAMAGCAVEVVAGGVAWTFGRREAA
ncbi:hypothetical protein ANO11243_009360 [Dothideomycetidae sp. 11243]|nr:hypothetical protein ANO11243_009360 [fungal sp. No.11243]